MDRTAIYPGTFDPITRGHVDVILRGASMFDRVVVAVAVSERKNTLLDFATRLACVEAVFTDQATIQVVALEGLLVDCARQCHAQVILRGLRSGADFDYEYPQVEMNQHLAPELETVFVAASRDTRFISSTMVREIYAVGGAVADFVPSEVMKELSWR